MSKSGFVFHEALAIDLTLRRLEAQWLPPAPDESTHYAYQALPSREFLDGLAVCRDALWTTSDESVGRRFLDVGCGLGTNLMLAFLSGWDVSGLEIYEPYIAAARKLMPDVEIIQGDAWAFDRYDEFDAVFQHNLCVDDDAQRDLEELISSRMHKGAIAFFGGHLSDYPMTGESLGNNCWRM